MSARSSSRALIADGGATTISVTASGVSARSAGNLPSGHEHLLNSGNEVFVEPLLQGSLGTLPLALHSRPAPRVVWRRPPSVATAVTAVTTSASLANYEVGAEYLRQSVALRDILEEIAVEPVEAGVTHVAEHLLGEFVRLNEMRPIRGALKDVVHGKTGADFVRLLGRVPDVDSATRLFVLECALRSPSVEVRDAGVQAAENWNDRGLTRSLRDHQDSVTWLAEYVRHVIEELEAH